MDRRFLFPLAVAVLGLVAVAPVLVSEPSASAFGSIPAKATTTSADPDSAPDAHADADSDSGGDSGSDGSDGGADSGMGPGADSGDSGTATTTPKSGSGSGSSDRTSSTTCDPPVTDRGPAPQVGDGPQTHEAGDAGTVDVERLSDSELRIAGASPNDGWTEEVKVASGPRVNVRFTRQGQSPSLIRFAASMDQKGTEIHIRVTSCG